MEAKIEKISELSKLLSVKTQMSDDLFHFLTNLVSVSNCSAIRRINYC